MDIERTRYAGFEAYLLSGEGWRAACIPELGGNIVELTDLHTGNQWLWINPSEPLKHVDFGAPYHVGTMSGFDECFPAIAPGPYPIAPYAGSPVADHGELWTQAWSVESDVSELKLSVQGVRFPYLFERTLVSSPGGRSLLLRYRVSNAEDAPLAYNWSSHPVLSAKPGMEVVIPGAPRVRIEHTIESRFGGHGDYLDPAAWSDDLCRIPECGPGVARNTKMFLEGVVDGWSAVYDPRSNSHLRLEFDSSRLHTVGVWIAICEGQGLDRLAIEPCIGTTDALDESERLGTSAEIPARSSAEWSLSLSFGVGRPAR